MKNKNDSSKKTSALDKMQHLVASTPHMNRRVKLDDVVPEAALLSPVVRMTRMLTPTKNIEDEENVSSDKDGSVPAKENTSQPLNTQQKEAEIMVIDDDEDGGDWLKTKAGTEKLVQKQKETVKKPTMKQSTRPPSKVSDGTKESVSKKRAVPATRELPSKRPHLTPEEPEFYDFLGDDHDNPRAASPMSPKNSDGQKKIDRPSQQQQATEKQGSPRKTTAKSDSPVKASTKPDSPMKVTAKTDFFVKPTAKLSPRKTTAKPDFPKKARLATPNDSEDLDMFDDIDLIMKNKITAASNSSNDVKTNKISSKKQSQKHKATALDQPGCSSDYNYPHNLDDVTEKPEQKQSKNKQAKRLANRYRKEPKKTSDEESEDEIVTRKSNPVPKRPDSPAPKQVKRFVDALSSSDENSTAKTQGKTSKRLQFIEEDEMFESLEPESQEEQLPKKHTQTKKILHKKSSVKDSRKGKKTLKRLQVQESSTEEDEMFENLEPESQEEQLPKKHTQTKKILHKKSSVKDSKKAKKTLKRLQVPESSTDEDDMFESLEPELQEEQLPKKHTQTKQILPKKSSVKESKKAKKTLKRLQVPESSTEEDEMFEDLEPESQDEQLLKKHPQTNKNSPVKDSKKANGEEEEDDGELSDGYWDKCLGSDARGVNNTKAKGGKTLVAHTNVAGKFKKVVSVKKINAAARPKKVSTSPKKIISSKKTSAAVSSNKTNSTTSSKKNTALSAKKAPDDLNDGMRRSQRSRIKPLRYWKGERENVHINTLGEICVDIQRPVEEQQPAGKKHKPNGVVRREPNSISAILRKLAPPQDTVDQDETCELPSKIHMKLPLKPGGSLIDFEVVSEMKNMDVTSKFEGTKKQDDGFRFSMTLECPFLNCGYIRINQGVNKGRQQSNCVMVFTLMTSSKLQVQINGEDLMIGCGQHFWVPPGVSYDVKNVSSSPALLQYTSFQHQEAAKLA